MARGDRIPVRDRKDDGSTKYTPRLPPVAGYRALRWNPRVDVRGGAVRGFRAGPAGRRLADGPARDESHRHGGRAARRVLHRRTRVPRAVLHYFPENTWALTRVITISNTSPA